MAQHGQQNMQQKQSVMHALGGLFAALVVPFICRPIIAPTTPPATTAPAVFALSDCTNPPTAEAAPRPMSLAKSIQNQATQEIVEFIF